MLWPPQDLQDLGNLLIQERAEKFALAAHNADLEVNTRFVGLSICQQQPDSLTYPACAISCALWYCLRGRLLGAVPLLPVVLTCSPFLTVSLWDVQEQVAALKKQLGRT
jgi:hypothetical protein